MGWIYVITCDMYDSSNFKKIGFTEKVGLLEEEVRTSLLQRYATTLMCPRILQLVKVSNPRRAEKRTFQILEKFRIDKEIFKVDMTEVQSALQVVQKEFPPDQTGITKDDLEKLLCRIRKKENKLARNLPYQQMFSNWVRENKGMCNYQNQQNLNYFVNNMVNPCVTGSHFDWTKRSENQNALNSRMAHVRDSFQPNNWDCSDPSIQGFLKKLLTSV